MISAILLAAGKSTRMGKTKLLLPLGGKRILERSLINLAASGVNEIILVLGYDRKAILENIVFSPEKTRVVYNTSYEEGIASSIRTGVKAVSDNVTGIMIVLGDMPFVSPQIVNSLLEVFRKTEKSIVFPVYKDRRGHPIIFRRSAYYDKLMALTGDEGARKIVDTYPDDTEKLEIDSISIFVDLDSMEDYYEYLRRDHKGCY